MVYRLLLTSLVLLFLTCVSAAQPATPETLKGAEVITAAEAFELHKSGARFYDLRPLDLFTQGHIPEAVRMPYQERSERKPNFDPSRDRFGIMKLPAKRSVPLVFYGDDESSWAVYKAASIAVMAGYEKVHWFREGFQAWKGKGWPVQQ